MFNFVIVCDLYVFFKIHSRKEKWSQLCKPNWFFRLFTFIPVWIIIFFYKWKWTYVIRDKTFIIHYFCCTKSTKTTIIKKIQKLPMMTTEKNWLVFFWKKKKSISSTKSHHSRNTQRWTWTEPGLLYREYEAQLSVMYQLCYSHTY